MTADTINWTQAEETAAPFQWQADLAGVKACFHTGAVISMVTRISLIVIKFIYHEMQVIVMEIPIAKICLYVIILFAMTDKFKLSWHTYWTFYLFLKESYWCHFVCFESSVELGNLNSSGIPSSDHYYKHWHKILVVTPNLTIWRLVGMIPHRWMETHYSPVPWNRTLFKTEAPWHLNTAATCICLNTRTADRKLNNTTPSRYSQIHYIMCSNRSIYIHTLSPFPFTHHCSV